MYIYRWIYTFRGTRRLKHNGRKGGKMDITEGKVDMTEVGGRKGGHDGRKDGHDGRKEGEEGRIVRSSCV
jgi:hypothetical protein